MYSIHIYLFIYSESLIFGKMYDKESFFLAEIYLFSFYMQIDFIYSVCLKKIMTPPAWSTRKAVTPFFTFLSNIFKKQSRNLCFTPLLLCMTHNDLPTKCIFIKENARWSGIHYYYPYDRCGLTWMILCPLSALSLDEGLNALNGKNASAAGWFSRPIKYQL